MAIAPTRIGAIWEHMAEHTLWTVVGLSPTQIDLVGNSTGESALVSWAFLNANYRRAVSQNAFGAFVGGSDQAAAVAMEAFMRRNLDFVVDFGDAGLVGNIYMFPAWVDRSLSITQPLTVPGWDMATTATGAHDAEYETAADNLALANIQGRVTAVRIGWEFNGDWEPWSIGGAGTNQTKANYIACFRRFALMIRARVPGMAIDWCCSYDRELASGWYPGDDVVDIVGADVYLNSAFIPNDWNFVLNAPSGLIWQRDFARAHGKQISFPEWASNYNDTVFVTNMAQWFRDNEDIMAYHAYWNSNASFQGLLSDYPAIQSAYFAAFGVP